MLLVIGDAGVDIAGAIPRFPADLEEVPLEAVAWSSGGRGVHVAAAFARLSGRARLLARVGRDEAAEIALASATQSGVDLYRLAFGAAPSSAVSAERLDLAITWLRGQGAKTVVVKRGHRGSTVMDGARRDIAPFVITSSGAAPAGDAFVAGFLWAYTAVAELGLSARLGNAVGALSASLPRSSALPPSFEDVASLLEANGAVQELALVRAPPAPDRPAPTRQSH